MATANPVDSFFKTSDSVRLHFLDWRGNGPLALLLAGAGFSARIFHPLALELRRNFRVVGLTRRGHGLSDTPEGGYDLRSLTRDIRAFLGHLAQQPACIVGHSLAGYELRTLLEDWPDFYSPTVLLDAVYPDDFPAPDLGRDPVWSVLKTAPEASDCHSPDALLRFYRSNRPDLASNWEPFLEREILSSVTVDGNFDPATSRLRRAHVQPQLAAALNGGWPDFSPFRCPLLAIVPNGKHNPLCPPDASEDLRQRADDFHERVTLPWIRARSQALREALPRARVIEMDESNHSLFLPQRLLVADHIHRFVQAARTLHPS